MAILGLGTVMKALGGKVVALVAAGVIIWGLWQLYQAERESSASLEKQLAVISTSIMISQGRVAALVESLEEIQTRQTNTLETLRQLELENAEVKEFLSTPFPAELNRLLNSLKTGKQDADIPVTFTAETLSVPTTERK